MPSNNSPLPPAQDQSFRPIDSQQLLPIFLCELKDYSIFYAPGFVCLVPQKFTTTTKRRITEFTNTNDAWALKPPSHSSISTLAAFRIVRAAQTAKAETQNARGEKFSSECLTIFLNNACNLKCCYCHAAPGAKPDRPITDAAVNAAAKLVASSCAKKQLPFTVAFHGGGEPTLDMAHMNRIMNMMQDNALKQDVPLRTYIATNGVMPAEIAQWLAPRFDLVGLSCDGPPNIQDQQRRTRDGRSTSSFVKQTVAILQQNATVFHVRATITKETLQRQQEITAYFIEHYGPTEIRLEPVYVNPAVTTSLAGEDASFFVAEFMEAFKLAAAKGIRVTTSMTRPASLYGRYCNVLRHVINLVPGDIVTGCFLESRKAGINGRQVRLGAMNFVTSFLDLDMDRIESLRSQCAEIPNYCKDCLCCYQCTYGCPEVCLLKETTNSNELENIRTGFLCRAHQLLMNTLICESARNGWRDTAPNTNRDILIAATMLPVAVYKKDNGQETGP